MHITPSRKTEFQALIQDDPLLCSLAETIIVGWPDNINDAPHALCPYHGHRNILTVEDGLILWGEALIIPSSEREKILQAIHEGHMGIRKCQNRANTVFIGLESTQRSNVSLNHAQHANVTAHRNHYSYSSQHQLWNTNGNSSALSNFHYDGSEYLVVTDYYSKMPIIKESLNLNAMPPRPSQSLRNSSQNMASWRYSILTMAPQFANALFNEFATDWKLNHNTSSPRNPRSNGQAETAIKTIKRLLICAKCSGQDPYLALLAYHGMPIDAHLLSPVEMLYQWVLHTTVPQQIRHTDPDANAEHDHLNQHATQSAEYHSQGGCHKKPAFFASQTTSVLNHARNLWLPVTIICKANNGSYLIQVIGGRQYRCVQDHIQECHPDVVKPDKSNIGNVAPATSASAPATQAVRLPTAVAPTTLTPTAPAATLQLHAKLHLQYVHHNEQRHHPLEPLQARLAHPLLS